MTITYEKSNDFDLVLENDETKDESWEFLARIILPSEDLTIVDGRFEEGTIPLKILQD